jgi:hypothetical protein
MKFVIYQVANDKIRDFGFMGLRERKAILKTDEIRMDVYERVWEGEIEEQPKVELVLEKLFTIFNSNHPKGYTGRSLSVSDLILFPETGTWYYCDSFGWEEVNPTFTREQCKLGDDVR